MRKLEALQREPSELQQNRLLFDWLCDDRKRVELYAELHEANFPVMRFKSVLRSGCTTANWPQQEVYLLSGKKDIETALKHYSVAPYSELDSGGRFMLGLDSLDSHKKQNGEAVAALRFTAEQIRACAREAYQRTAVLPLKNHQFDLATDFAERAALHFVSLLYGLRDPARGLLRALMRGAYSRLTFQIIGRHFVSDSGQLPAGSSDVEEAKRDLEEHIRNAIRQNDAGLVEKGLPRETVIGRLFERYGPRAEEPVFVALGLMAGTIGNVRAAVTIAIDHFFTQRNGAGRLIDQARHAAWNDEAELKQLIDVALVANPPAPFLARTARGRLLAFDDFSGHKQPIPEGAHVMLAMGTAADDALVYGGADGDGFLHRCIGEHLARPLIVEVVREVLRLPGLAQVIDPDDGAPTRVKKQWGALCESYPLQYRRDRLLRQEQLYVVLPIKAPVKENAAKLELLTKGGAHLVEEALHKSRHVHFAWFNLVENGTHLAMSTVFDGDFDAYVEHFALDVPMFDEQFELLDVDQPTPIRAHPKQFVETIRKYRRLPLGGYFYSAYPRTCVADIYNAKVDAQ